MEFDENVGQTAVISHRAWPDKCTDQLTCSCPFYPHPSVSMLVPLQSMLIPPYLCLWFLPQISHIEVLYNPKMLFPSTPQWPQNLTGSNLHQPVRWSRKHLPLTNGDGYDPQSIDGCPLTALGGEKAGTPFSDEVIGIPSLAVMPCCVLVFVEISF